MNRFALEVEHVSKHYGARVAVSDVSFAIAPGEIVGFLGPNGAGKTTTLRLITGYLRLTQGVVRIVGQDIEHDLIEARRQFGYMPERAPLYREMRVQEYLKYRARLKGLRGAAIAERMERSLEQANAADAKARVIGQLSKGYRQRVALADALLSDPPILILDEPSSGLDPNQIREFRTLIRSFAGKKAILLSTHILPEVEASCDRVIVIHRGQMVADKTIQELQTSQTKLEDLFATLTREEAAA